MMYFSSDPHFFHKNIIKFCPDSRGQFKDVDHMNREIVKRFNSVLTMDDTLVLLGDIVFGGIEQNIGILDSIVCGKKFLVPGNHDACWIGEEKDARREKYLPIYEKHFDMVVKHPLVRIEDIEDEEEGVEPRFVAYANHFPYVGDSHDKPRFDNFRLPDQGDPLLHGHTHSTERISHTNKGTLQIHVGVDAWDFYPVPMSTIKELVW